jgi:hypothetical protein
MEIPSVKSMTRAAWHQPTDFETVKRRAAGRGRWNRLRQLRADLRRAQLAHLMAQVPPEVRIPQAELARQLGVSTATICRDLQRLTRRLFQDLD